MTAARDRQTALVRPIGITVRRLTVRPHPSLGCALRPASDSPNVKMTSICAGHRLGGAPRRNRTGDPILTMEPPGTAVRTAVSPGRARLIISRSLLGGGLSSPRSTTGRRPEGHRRDGRSMICPASTSTCDSGIPVTAPTSLAWQAMATEKWGRRAVARLALSRYAAACSILTAPPLPDRARSGHADRVAAAFGH
jgi:hypothetical protein